MKNSRKVIAFLLAIAIMFLPVLDNFVYANKVEIQDSQEESIFTLEESPFEYEENDDGTITITGYEGGNPPKDLVLPDEIDGKPVVKIGTEAFLRRKFGDNGVTTDIESLELPDLLKEIGEKAFHGQDKLSKLELGNEIETIGARAFRETNLGKIIIPKNIKYIGEYAFDNVKLTEIEFEDSEEIELELDKAVFANNLISEVTIPNRVTKWPEGASVFRSNKINGVRTFVKVYNDSGATENNTFGIINPTTVTIKSIFSDGKEEEIKVVGKELRSLEGNGRNLEEIEGSGNYLKNYKSPVDTFYVEEHMDKIVGNYYQQGKEYTFEAPEIDGIKPESQIVKLEGKEETITFIYGKEEEEDLTKVDKIELYFPGDEQVSPLVEGEKQIIKFKALNSKGEELEGEEIEFKSSNPEALKYSFLDTFTAGKVEEETEVLITGTLKSNPEIKDTIKVIVSPKEQIVETPFEYEDNEDGTITITGYEGGNPPKDLVLPDEIDGKPVTKIKDGAFRKKSWGIGSIDTSLKSVKVGKNLEEIGENAFNGHEIEELIDFENSNVNSIGEKAFYRNKIKDLNLPQEMRTIGEQAYGNNGLEKLVLNDGLKSIEAKAFENNSIEEVRIPETVTEITGNNNNSIFHGNKIDGELTFVKVYIAGENLNSLKAENIFGIINPVEVKIEYKNTNVEPDAVVGKRIKIIDGNRKLADGDKKNIYSYNYQSKDSINPYDLAENTLRNAVESNYEAISNNYYQQGKEETITFIYGKEEEEDLTKVDKIELYFPGDEQVSPLVEGGKQIINFRALNSKGEEIKGEKIDFSSSNPEALKYSFLDTFTAGKVEEETEVLITGTLRSNPEITDTIKVIVSPKEQTVETSFEYEENEDGTIKITGYRKGEKLPKELIIPEKIGDKDVTVIGEKAFENKRSIEKVTIPGSVKEIEKEAFRNAGLTSIEFAEGLETIGDNAFGSNALMEVLFPESLENIPSEHNKKPIFSHNKIGPKDWSGKLRIPRIYSKKDIGMGSTFGINNPTEVEIKYVDGSGKQIKESIKVVGFEKTNLKLEIENTVNENGITEAERVVTLEEGSKEYIRDYILEKDGPNFEERLNYINDLENNYYQQGKEYTFEAPEIDGIKPESQTVKLEKEEETITFIYEKKSEEKEDLEVEFIEPSAVENNKTLKADAKLTNKTKVGKKATLIVGLYDRNTNKLVNYSMVDKTINPNETVEMSAGFLIPEKGDFYVKAFIWDGIDTQNIIMKEHYVSK